LSVQKSDFAALAGPMSVERGEIIDRAIYLRRRRRSNPPNPATPSSVRVAGSGESTGAWSDGAGVTVLSEAETGTIATVPSELNGTGVVTDGGTAVWIGGGGTVSTISGLVSVSTGGELVLSAGGGAMTGESVDESGTP
jgi:hypothetical protein